MLVPIGSVVRTCDDHAPDPCLERASIHVVCHRDVLLFGLESIQMFDGRVVHAPWTRAHVPEVDHHVHAHESILVVRSIGIGEVGDPGVSDPVAVADVRDIEKPQLEPVCEVRYQLAGYVAPGTGYEHAQR